MEASGKPDGERDPSVGELFSRLSEQTSTLIRNEMALARAELKEKGKAAGVGAGMFGGAGALGFYALGALTACLILALATFLEGWIAALIVAAVYGAVAGILALTGRKKVKQAGSPVPEQAVESMKEDVEVAKQRAQAGRA
jgi:MFS family permease